ncbi:hypothetical protein ARMGADRAFT_1085279 [Armillaria gallica]|uniref:SLC26A/SulP transporter domain-containing protein n=1 Tax=Armillaria gallica TaxID=47427 RepID=A0A2H3CX62_ARMGA|nr:hypothetical protein ARMGADRAFT_1085279 [Armillaria gallica]
MVILFKGDTFTISKLLMEMQTELKLHAKYDAFIDLEDNQKSLTAEENGKGDEEKEEYKVEKEETEDEAVEEEEAAQEELLRYFIVLGIELFQLGCIVDFIPALAGGLMTGSAISIIAGQFLGLMGITGFKYAF